MGYTTPPMTGARRATPLTAAELARMAADRKARQLDPRAQAERRKRATAGMRPAGTYDEHDRGDFAQLMRAPGAR